MQKVTAAREGQPFRASDCWRTQPEVRPDNERAWGLYSLFEKQWDAGMSGYRLRYIYDPLINLAAKLGIEGDALLDVVERVRLIEDAMGEVETLRYQRDERERKRKAKHKGNGDGQVIGKG